MTVQTVNIDDARLLFELLRKRRFVKAKDIAMPPRKVRAICSEYPHRFLSTQDGYCLVAEATPAEIENAVADLRSRCAKMTARADKLERALMERTQRDLYA